MNNTMSLLSVNHNSVVVVKGLNIDVFHDSKHSELSVTLNTHENDVISDVIISNNGKYFAIITAISKQLIIYDLPITGNCRRYTLPRSASKIRFTLDDKKVLVADKSGDVILYNLEENDGGTKLLGHLSLLLDVLLTNDEKYIISSDRDEKIRVSRFPNTYNIQTYCLGHKEFVNHIELLPHSPSYLTSTSGDGHINCWDYVSGQICYTIDTFQDVNDLKLKEDFIKSMDLEIVQVEALPIVHYSISKLDEKSSLLAVTIYSFNKILLYVINTENNKFNHILINKVDVERFPSAIALNNFSLYIYDGIENTVRVFKILNSNNVINVEFENKIDVFSNTPVNLQSKENCNENIKVLYKRKFDNVQEYQERKRQRLEKSEKSNK